MKLLFHNLEFFYPKNSVDYQKNHNETTVSFKLLTVSFTMF